MISRVLNPCRPSGRESFGRMRSNFAQHRLKYRPWRVFHVRCNCCGCCYGYGRGKLNTSPMWPLASSARFASACSAAGRCPVVWHIVSLFSWSLRAASFAQRVLMTTLGALTYGYQHFSKNCLALPCATDAGFQSGLSKSAFRLPAFFATSDRCSSRVVTETSSRCTFEIFKC